MLKSAENSSENSSDIQLACDTIHRILDSPKQPKVKFGKISSLITQDYHLVSPIDTDYKTTGLL